MEQTTTSIIINAMNILEKQESKSKAQQDKTQ